MQQVGGSPEACCMQVESLAKQAHNTLHLPHMHRFQLCIAALLLGKCNTPEQPVHLALHCGMHGATPRHLPASLPATRPATCACLTCRVHALFHPGPKPSPASQFIAATSWIWRPSSAKGAGLVANTEARRAPRLLLTDQEGGEPAEAVCSGGIENALPTPHHKAAKIIG